METGMMIEVLGYLGSALVVISMLMSSVVKLRVINTIGSVISGTYGLIIGSFPLALMNFCLITINLYNLFKLLRSQQQYEVIEGKAEDTLLKYFLEYYKEDIKIYFPEFQVGEPGLNVADMVYCKAEPVGILLGKDRGKGELEIAIEYTTPAYRDCSVGRHLYSQLSRRGVKRLIFPGKSEKHGDYLEKMGYVKAAEGYVRELGANH